MLHQNKYVEAVVAYGHLYTSPHALFVIGVGFLDVFDEAPGGIGAFFFGQPLGRVRIVREDPHGH